MKLTHTTRQSAYAMIIAASMFLVGCDKDDDEEDAKTLTVTETVVASPDFTLLEAAVIKAGLAETLNNTTNLTVFAPDDAAFKLLDLNGDGTPDLDTEAKINALNAAGVTLLKKVLQYHVLGTRVASSAVPAGPNAPVASLDGENIFVTRNTNGVYVNGVKVKSADVNASNGVIHVIDRVLIPSGGVDIVGIAGANPNFSYLVAAVTRADASGTSISGALKAAGPLTVFAPVNQAFIDAGFPTIASIQAADANTLKNILLYHVVPARVFSSDLTEGAKPATAGGATVTITLGGGAKVKGNSSPVASNIVVTNVMASNGVIHAIDKVLIP
ncbi:fasciclin domain-containing protein [Flavitalea antarctica]